MLLVVLHSNATVLFVADNTAANNTKATIIFAILYSSMLRTPLIREFSNKHAIGSKIR